MPVLLRFPEGSMVTTPCHMFIVCQRQSGECDKSAHEQTYLYLNSVTD